MKGRLFIPLLESLPIGALLASEVAEWALARGRELDLWVTAEALAAELSQA